MMKEQCLGPTARQDGKENRCKIVLVAPWIHLSTDEFVSFSLLEVKVALW